ncbi:hypothetical protein MRX96_008815 [Rhipicephalus microplus]
MDDSQLQDICRVCRSEGAPDKPLFHPCICTGSIKYIHQDCLVQWLKYSRKEYCELCNHRFSFMPIYSPDMPKRLPIRDIVSGLLSSLGTAIRYWLHYTVVAFAWLGIVPLTACRIYRCLFTGSVSSLLTLPLDMLSTENLLSDSLYGCCIVTCTLCAFISLVWLREQVIHGEGPDWLEQDPQNVEGLAEAEPGEVVGPPLGPVPHHAEEPPAQADDHVAQDDINWNPIEWDRAAEELTWERLLGLDGSLVFLEHVFWVVSLNTLFILVFAFCPYHIGQFAIMGFRLKSYVAVSQFEGLLTTLCGYVLLGVVLVFLHGLAALVKLRRTQRLLGLCYVVVKSMLDATLSDRESSFQLAPGTFMFLHWLVGMVYVFYFASFVLLLREVLRPGLLWFLRNLNDPDFNPIQEMIHLPILQHVRRFLVSLVIFGFLPYHVLISSESPSQEISLELILLQVVLPTLLEQGHMKQWLKALVRAWCVGVACLLDLHSYLLGDAADTQTEQDGAAEGGQQAEDDSQLMGPLNEVDEEVDDEEEDDEDDEEEAGAAPVVLGAAHQALLQGPGPSAFQAYQRPRWFPLRLAALLCCIAFSLTALSFAMLTIPVSMGRLVMMVLMPGGKVHEFYTAACGLYSCWLTLRCLTLLCSWLPRGWNTILAKLHSWMLISVKSLVAMSLLLGLIPLLMGLLFDLVVIIPLRVPLNATPLFYLWHDWALGVLHTKIICAVTLMGPNWWLKRVIDEMYQDGVRQLNLRLVVMDLVVPVVVVLGLALAVPYLLATSLVPAFGSSMETQNLVLRRIYPSLLALCAFMAFMVFQVRQFCRLYEHIKNDKYLVGRRLVNYEHRRPASSFATTSQLTASS